MFERCDHLGFMAPYYSRANGQLVFAREFSEILKYLEKPHTIDACAIIEIISRYHCFADRTIVHGVHRVPWMAKANSDNTGWEIIDIPPHSNLLIPENDVAGRLFIKLQEEILDYCSGFSTVGILLSGGMDSRIVAGVVDFLIKTNQASFKVIAITWGMKESRDVIYAQLIARRLGWDWIHFPVSAEELLNNILETAKRGCEFSPVHLHAMPKVRNISDVDCILAASFGDSIGRAEYSGRHVTQLVSFDKYTLNWFKLLRRDVYKEAYQLLTQDIKYYRTLFPRKYGYQQHEIDQQAHYMQRKLNHCMSVINENIPLFQIFTSPSVFRFMWSLSPQIRNNMIYKHLLSLFKTELADIPWARTGQLYLIEGNILDNHPSLSHRYGEWIRNDLFDLIKKKVLSENISQLNIFNMQALESTLEMNRRISRKATTTKIDEISIWLASLADFIQIYSIKGNESNQTFLDDFNSIIISPLEVISLETAKFLLSQK
jgi:hypothetical protein